MRENKYYCDRCKKEVNRKDLYIFSRDFEKFVKDGSYDYTISFLDDSKSYDLCSYCLKDVYQAVNKIIRKM